MTPAVSARLARFLPIAAAAVFCATAALAQGTAEQREACTPDALRLCADTIPDVGRTSACMRAHKTELSPRCRAAFAPEAAPAPTLAARVPAPRVSARELARKRVARLSPAAKPVSRERHRAERPVAKMARASVIIRHRTRARDTADTDVAAGMDTASDRAVDARDRRRARVVIGRLCRTGTLDPSACRLAALAIDLSR